PGTAGGSGDGNAGRFGQSVASGTGATASVCDTGNGGTGNTGNGDTPLGTTVGRGECTDWALDRRPDLAGAVNGNAQAWTDEARAAGRPMSKTPSEGDLMVLQGGVMGAGGATGHVAYVESVERDANGNPTSFTISEQNWNGSKSSTSRTIPVSDLPGDGVDFVG